MAEDIITIGIAYDSSRLVTGTRQAETELRKLEQAERSGQQQAQSLERATTQAGAALTREAHSASQATSALGQAGQAAGGAATQHGRLEQQATEAAGALKQTSQAATQAADSLQKTSQATGAASSNLDRLVSRLGDFGRSVGSFAIAQAGVSSLQAALQTALGLAQASVQAAVQTQSLSATFKVLEGSSAAANQTMTFLRATADRLGVNFSNLATGFRTVSAAARGTTLEGQQIRDVFTAMAEAGRVLGLSSHDLNGILLAIGQTISKGTVQAEELRGQIGERLPSAFNIAARAMGVTTQKLGEMMEAGELQATTFWPKFADQIKQELGGGVDEASKSAGAALERFNNSMQDLQIATGQFLLPALRAAIDLFNTLTGAAGKAAKSIKDYHDVLQQVGQEEADRARQGRQGAQPQGLEGQLKTAQAELARLQQERAALGTWLGRANQGLLGQDTTARENALREQEVALKGRIIALEKQQETRRKVTAATDPFGEGIDNAFEPGGRNEQRVKFLETVTKLTEGYAKAQERLEVVTKATYGRAPTQEERLKAMQDQDKEVQKAIKGQESLLHLYKDSSAVKALRDRMQATEALDKAIDQGKEAEAERKRQEKERETQEEQDARERLADVRRKGEAALTADSAAVDLRDELIRKTEALAMTEEERLGARVKQLGEEHKAHQQVLDDEYARYLAARRTAEALKERDERLKEEAQTSATYLSDLQRLEKQLEPARRRMSTAERHQQAIAELAARAKPEDRAEVLGRAIAKSTETLEAEQWQEWRDAGVDAIEDITHEFTRMAFEGKLSFTDLANHAVAQLFRIASEATSRALFKEGGWLELALNAGMKLLGATTGAPQGGDGRFTGGDAPGMQHGGPVTAGHPYMVGEVGPELFIPRQSGTILPHSQSTPMAGPTIVFNLHGVTDASSFVAARGAIQRTVAQAVQASYQAM